MSETASETTAQRVLALQREVERAGQKALDALLELQRVDPGNYRFWLQCRGIQVTLGIDPVLDLPSVVAGMNAGSGRLEADGAEARRRER